MFNIFSKKSQISSSEDKNLLGFEYLEKGVYYFDSACQTLRPQPVIDAENEYYYKYNSCGHRVKYKWGEITDQKVEECRENLLKLSGKTSRDFTVAFGLNTTAGINTVLMQLPSQGFKTIITSEIEHNSVFLPSLVYSQKNNLKRLVLDRSTDGSLKYDLNDLEKAIVILNTTSNIDGRELVNLEKLANDIHKQEGILLLDACQTFSHHPELLQKIDFDAVFGSGHKMYGPSVGFTIIKKKLLLELEPFLIGGSTVSSVKLDSYQLIEDDSELYSRIEPGLQNYAGIIGLNEAIKWRKNFSIQLSSLSTKLQDNQIDISNLGFKSNQAIDASGYERILAVYLNERLKTVPNIKILNESPSPVVSLYPTLAGVDGHKLAMYLSQVGISGRSGYHCCHYYLIEKLHLPPQFRISIALHNTLDQIDYLIEKMKIVL